MEIIEIIGLIPIFIGLITIIRASIWVWKDRRK